MKSKINERMGKKMTKSKRTIALAASMAMVVGTAQAAVVFSDDFEDGNRDGWYELSDGTSTMSIIASPMASGGTAALLSSDATALQIYATHFDAVTLEDPGDFVTLKFDARRLEPGFQGRGFRFGLYNSSNTLFSADGDLDQADVSLDDYGYHTLLTLARSTNAEVAAFRAQRAAGGTASPAADRRTWSSDVFLGRLENGNDPDPLLLPAQQDNIYFFRITRTADGGLDLVLYNDKSYAAKAGSFVLSIGAADVITYTFDTVYFSHGRDGVP
ncbi:MAG: hypothetical protein PVJ71_03460, partial [Lysobacterales bacterium]